MRNRTFGVIGVVWGGFILVNLLSKGNIPSGDGAYGSGQMIGAGFGVLLLAAGTYYLIRGDGPPAKKKKKKRAIRTPKDSPMP